MSSMKELSEFRHQLSNPLAALLSEAQLALLDRETLPAHAVESFERIERLALRIREMLRQQKQEEGGRMDDEG